MQWLATPRGRRQKTLQVQIGYRPSAQQLLVDSTGIQFLGEG